MFALSNDRCHGCTGAAPGHRTLLLGALQLQHRLQAASTWLLFSFNATPKLAPSDLPDTSTAHGLFSFSCSLLALLQKKAEPQQHSTVAACLQNT